MTRTNVGVNKQSDQLGGGGLGATGSATSPTATGFTCTGLTSGAHVGKLVTLGGVWGVITANTATAVTVDQWYTPGTAAAAATPSAGTFVILPGQAPAMFMALTYDVNTALVTDTTLASETTTAGSGMLRKLATYAHTTNATSYTMAATFTYTSTDNGTSHAFQKMGMFDTAVPGSAGIMQFETNFTAATLTATGDAVTTTQTVSE